VPSIGLLDTLLDETWRADRKLISGTAMRRGLTGVPGPSRDSAIPGTVQVFEMYCSSPVKQEHVPAMLWRVCRPAIAVIA
jgi:hypothetical protein